MAVESHIHEVSEKHEKLQRLIEEEMTHAAWNEGRVQFLKKQKLRLKDQLERLRTH